jgi:hypothetical protein
MKPKMIMGSDFATLKNVIDKSTTYPYCDIHKHTWTSPDDVTYNQIIS